MRMEKGLLRHIHYINPKPFQRKTLTGKELAEKLHELARSLEEPSTANESFRGVTCQWKGGVCVEIHATPPKA